MEESMILVTGAGGFIGGHLVGKLTQMGESVRAVDIKPLSEWWQVHQSADSVGQADLTILDTCLEQMEECSQVYNLAADMGGMGFIHSAECEIMRHSALINLNMVEAAAKLGVGRYFFSSSVCVYPDMMPGDDELSEEQVYPANPDNEYGWEKLYAERTALAYGRRYGMTVRIARFQNCFGPYGEWDGGREKAPAALCRKVAQAGNGGVIEVWGDGSAVRSYTYISDMVDGIVRLMSSELEGPVNIGNPEYVTVDELVQIICEIADRKVTIKHVDGPVGVHSRNFSIGRIESLGWKANYSTKDGIAKTYPWIAEQVRTSLRNIGGS
ncbi:MAG: NAD-dependent epimerase/dehydratase family protein [Actinomycetota bacterium]|nr:MAG: NAD-dependent epimerase/dehydratase family protein [Actinomycetota bacterium]